jgi:hypothetical protein
MLLSKIINLYLLNKIIESHIIIMISLLMIGELFFLFVNIFCNIIIILIEFRYTNILLWLYVVVWGDEIKNWVSLVHDWLRMLVVEHFAVLGGEINQGKSLAWLVIEEIKGLSLVSKLNMRLLIKYFILDFFYIVIIILWISFDILSFENGAF